MDRISPLSSPTATRLVLERHGLATKHALGQNFLVNDDVLKKIVALADIDKDDVVLEVGPGIGTLTIALLKTARAVVSIERDADLPAVLAETCEAWDGSFALIEKDALEVRAADIEAACAGFAALRSSADADAVACADASGGASPTFPNKFVANLPYAVAATVVLGYFEQFPQIESETIMVQKEVADRMAARPGSKDYGAYTVKLGLYASVRGRFAVGPGNFFPPPRVDSAVIRLDRSTPTDDAGLPIGEACVRAACEMADAAFTNRRKTISNSCKTYFSGRGDSGARVAAELPQLFERAGVDARRRGETLTREEFVRLGQELLAFREASL